MPVFMGENLDGWLLIAERFFDLHKYIESERIEAAVVGFEGDALIWTSGKIRGEQFSQGESFEGY